MLLDPHQWSIYWSKNDVPFPLPFWKGYFTFPAIWQFSPTMHPLCLYFYLVCIYFNLPTSIFILPFPFLPLSMTLSALFLFPFDICFPNHQWYSSRGGGMYFLKGTVAWDFKACLLACMDASRPKCDPLLILKLLWCSFDFWQLF